MSATSTHNSNPADAAGAAGVESKGKFKVGDKCFAAGDKIFPGGEALNLFGITFKSTVLEGEVVGQESKKKIVRWSVPKSDGTVFPFEKSHGSRGLYLERSEVPTITSKKEEPILVPDSASSKAPHKRFKQGETVFGFTPNILDEKDAAAHFTKGWDNTILRGSFICSHESKAEIYVSWEVGPNKLERWSPSRVVFPSASGFASIDSVGAATSITIGSSTPAVGSSASSSATTSYSTPSPVASSLPAAVPDTIDLVELMDDELFASEVKSDDEEEADECDSDDDEEASPQFTIDWKESEIPECQVSNVASRCFAFNFPTEHPTDPCRRMAPSQSSTLDAVLLLTPERKFWMDRMNAALPTDELMNEGEFFLLLMLLIVSSRFRIPRDAFWSDAGPNKMISCRNFSTCMSRRRFYVLLAALDGVRDESAHIWDFADDWLDAIGAQARRKIAQFPGVYIFDESMIPYYGLKASNHAFKEKIIPNGAAPPMQSIPRKPRGIGAEVQTAVVVPSEWGVQAPSFPIMTHFSLVSFPRQDPIYNDLPPSVQSAVRACLSIQGRGGICVADAGYGSVQTVLAVKKICGMDSLMAVKTITTGFPKKRLQEMLASKPLGGSAFLVAYVQGVRLIAVGWKVKEKMNAFYIATFGTTTMGVSARKKRFSAERKMNMNYEVTRPLLVEFYHTWFNKVDVSNKIRQAGFRLEMCVSGWRKRIMLWGWGQILTNAFAFWTWDHRKDAKMEGRLTRETFTNLLVDEIFEKYAPPPLSRSVVVTRLSAEKSATAARAQCSMVAAKFHPIFAHFGKDGKVVKTLRRNCIGCNARTTKLFMCNPCSTTIVNEAHVKLYCEHCIDTHKIL